MTDFILKEKGNILSIISLKTANQIDIYDFTSELKNSIENAKKKFKDLRLDILTNASLKVVEKRGSLSKLKALLRTL